MSGPAPPTATRWAFDVTAAVASNPQQTKAASRGTGSATYDTSERREVGDASRDAGRLTTDRIMVGACAGHNAGRLGNLVDIAANLLNPNGAATLLTLLAQLGRIL